MRIALDASYSVDQHPSGIAIYSREILSGLAASYPGDDFVHYYRPKQLLASERALYPNVQRRVLIPSFLAYEQIFHALNQRVESRSAKRVIVTFHDLFVLTADYSSADFRARFAEQARQAAEKADVIIAVSHFTAGQVCDLLRFDPSRIRVVPHGVHMPEPAVGVPREPMVLFVGALQIRKNVTRLVEAFASLPDDWTLTLAGSTTGYRSAEILARIDASPCSRRINIRGYIQREELEDLYRRASIFAFPSLDEGFGMPVLDAMAHGVPVITSNNSALREVAGDAALTVNPQCADEIAAALLQLASHQELREIFQEKGYRRVTDFSWNRAVFETHKVYEEFTT
ncbi:MAG: glycosyltransferase family 4 protein [Acidobacteriaceae bacterium]|nr:glycosyltransferase family 4 protein [Acidobacteriaceae bacterium]MBV8571549.1 glycosyltransferase family 4 protein [Acidobacteriaceae bacterium]